MSKTNGRKAQPKKSAAPRKRGLPVSDLEVICRASRISPDEILAGAESRNDPHKRVLVNLLRHKKDDEMADKVEMFLRENDAIDALRKIAAFAKIHA